MKNRQPNKLWTVWFIFLFTSVVMTACTLSTANETQLVETLSAQGTWIAHLSTQVAGQEEKNFSQWEAIGNLYTQMPFAQGTITPTPYGQADLPTPTPYTLVTPTPYLDIEYPPQTRTGIDEIDTVIDAILDGLSQRHHERVVDSVDQLRREHNTAVLMTTRRQHLLRETRILTLRDGCLTGEAA